MDDVIVSTGVVIDHLKVVVITTLVCVEVSTGISDGIRAVVREVGRDVAHEVGAWICRPVGRRIKKVASVVPPGPFT